MTLKQAIERYRQYINFCEYQGLAVQKEELEQMTAWLRELQERRKAPEIVYCKDCRKHNVKVGFDENFHTVWKEDACPLVDWRGKAKEHEFDYQYCAFAERRTE